MATIRVQDLPKVPPAESIEQRFRHLEAQWKADTEFLSDAGKIVNYPAFRAMIALGSEVVPFMLRDLEAQPCLWVWALPEITGANPVSPADGGNIAKMSAAWMKRAAVH